MPRELFLRSDLLWIVQPTKAPIAENKTAVSRMKTTTKPAETPPLAADCSTLVSALELSVTAALSEPFPFERHEITDNGRSKVNTPLGSRSSKPANEA